MELPIYPKTNVLKHVHQIFEPFMIDRSSQQDQPEIMPLYQVEKQLHTHYVNLQPIEITYEFYDQDDFINQRSIIVKVDSTLLSDRRIVLTELHGKRTFILPIEQILSVSANIAN